MLNLQQKLIAYNWLKNSDVYYRAVHSSARKRRNGIVEATPHSPQFNTILSGPPIKVGPVLFL